MSDELELWPSQEPPSGFAERVISARVPPRRGRWMAAAAAAVLLVAGATWLRPVRGSAAPAARTQLALGRRGVAVAEAGAALRWTVRPTGAAVEQDQGDVFYRVEHGGPFKVVARGIEVEVTGTCFRVEVQEMGPRGKMIASAAAGAAAASAVLITVYEGSVRVTSEGTGREVLAGEQARASRGSATQVGQATSTTPPALLAEPASADDRHSSREELVQRSQQERTRIAQLQARVKELEQERGKLLARPRDTRPEEQPGADGLPPRNKFHDFTPAELQAMARNCEVRMDVPPLEREPWRMSPELGARLHLSEDEQAKAAEAVNAVRVDALARLRALYIEATNDLAGADNVDMTTGRDLLRKSKRADVEAARAKVARERAGIDPPPADPNAGTIPERYFRYMVTLGDSLQQKLEPALGVQGASTAREQLTFSKMTMNGCDDPR